MRLLDRFETSISRRVGNLWLICRMLWLFSINRYSSRPLTQPDGPVVSLTSYGKRIHTVYYPIESIGRGTLRPSRLILWLDDNTAFDHPPTTLRRLMGRGLELKLCQNYGPHTKFYPYVESELTFRCPLISADDDVLYPRSWIQGLVGAYQQFPDVINCYLAKTIAIRNDQIGRYSTWIINASTDASYRYMGHGVNGVIYPPAYLMALKRAGEGFQQCCPKADDIWCHVQAIRAGFKVRQIRPKAKRFPALPGTQEDGLWVENNNGGNDRQVRATYSAEDVEIMRECNAITTNAG
jgi:hypothetical protein